ncbi:pentatricopeptide repeat-containing protein At1g80150, mitochondrial-like [Aristolochia californica]|uniref:pentatricopeptide repeat-containing protein At1g80150, mitochondrial-like n=1 Tax=Aristolochia californica TaxID=171875 RepID=UPI0035E2DC48
MLSRHNVRRCYAAIDTSTAFSTVSANCKQLLKLEPPALIRLKVERDPEKLFLLFKANSHNRLVIESSTTFDDTVSRLAGARRFDYIQELLEHQKALPQGRREGFIVRIIMLYGKARMFDQALRTFYDMHLFGCQRTVKSFNAALKVLSLTRNFDEVSFFFYNAPKKFGISLDEFSYNLVIKAFCEMACLSSACLITVEMEKAGIMPDVVTYTTLISALYTSNQHEIADGLWNLMVLRKCSPNIATFNVRIQYLINKRRAWQARSWMQKMLAFGVRPDELTFNLIIKGFCLIGHLDMAKRTFDALLHCNSGCKANHKIYQTMIHYLCKGEEYDLAFRLCKDSMVKNWFPSADTICKLFKGLMTISKDRNAKEIMMLVSGRVPPYSKDELTMFHAILSRKASFDARIQYLIKQNRASYAWIVLQKMIVLGVKPDELTFNLVIEGFCKICDLHMAKKVYDEMQAYGCKINSRVNETMICNLCEGEEFDLAFNICKESIVKNQFPSADGICKLLQGLKKALQYGNAEEIMNLIQEKPGSYFSDELNTFHSILSWRRQKMTT